MVVLSVWSEVSTTSTGFRRCGLSMCGSPASLSWCRGVPASPPSHLRLPPLRGWGRNVSIPIRHSNLRQALGVHDIVFLNDAVAVEHIGGQTVHFVRREMSVSIERHPYVDPAPEQRRKRPVKCLAPRGRPSPRVIIPVTERLRASGASGRSDEWRGRAFRSGGPMALGAAPRQVDHRALFGGAAPRRKSLAVGRDQSVRAPEFLLAWRST